MENFVSGPAFLLIPLFFFLLFFWNWRIEKRRIINGLLFNLFLASLAIGIGAYALTSQNNLFFILVASVGLLIIIAAIFGVYGLIVFLLWNARQVWRRESRSLGNMLTLFLGLGLILFLIIQNLPIKYPAIIESSFQLVNVIGAYFLFVFANYFTVNVLYQFNRPRLNQDFIIVLGAGLINGQTVSPLLAARVDRAVNFYFKQLNKTGQAPTLIMSGGKGNDEQISEAAAMKNYALSKGIPADLILLEDQAVNTLQNMTFSKKIILQKHPEPVRVIFTSSNYHIFRAALDARAVELKADGLGAKTAFYFLPNAFLREFAAVILKNKKNHLIVVAFLIVLTILIFLLNTYFS
ncbi:YdcF family protein [Enterococcus timonensis]|uniref:YdcF family protein n=1 Tax=Enterococcus timonensis TaxID=1852364 RepID=UPI0008DAF1C4|nr:YdcF family protein [Enterococcus timonensis]